MPIKGYFTFREAAKETGIGRESLRQAYRLGILPGLKAGDTRWSTVFVRLEDIARLANQKRFLSEKGQDWAAQFRKPSVVP